MSYSQPTRTERAPWSRNTGHVQHCQRLVTAMLKQFRMYTTPHLWLTNRIWNVHIFDLLKTEAPRISSGRCLRGASDWNADWRTTWRVARTEAAAACGMWCSIVFWSCCSAVLLTLRQKANSPRLRHSSKVRWTVFLPRCTLFKRYHWALHAPSIHGLGNCHWSKCSC